MPPLTITMARQVVVSPKKSRLCRECGKAQPFRTPGSTLKQLGWAACRKATGFPPFDRLRAVSEVERHIKRQSRRGVSLYAEEKPSDWS